MELDLDNDLRMYTLTLASQRGLDGQHVVKALVDVDIALLATLLGRDQPAVAADLHELHRALVIDGDWGAGCAILTAEVRAAANTALTTLITGRRGFDATSFPSR